MIIRQSQYIHLVALGGGRELCLHAVTGTKLVLSAEVVSLIRYFDTEQDMTEAMIELPTRLGCSAEVIMECAAALIEREILTKVSAEDEADQVSSRFADSYGRDPIELLERYQRERMEGSFEYWAVGAPRSFADFTQNRRAFRILLLGDCDVQMEADFLRAEAQQRGIDFKVASTFLHDSKLLIETPHDAVIVGALSSRHTIALGTESDHGGEPAKFFTDEAREVITRLRENTAVPILLNSLPVPTVQPRGLADRGIHSHRNRFRRANLELEQLAAEFPDVYVVDVDAALSACGKAKILDDSLVSFTHFGSLGWMLQRPASELAAVHGIFPDMGPHAESMGDGPYVLEKTIAREHINMLISVLGIESKKCVIVDLDGTLWPGVLAETGSPFAWSPEISSPYSFVGLYFGLHEALKALLERGILLACVSKGDEVIVRELWRYDDSYPHERLIHLDDFVATRINWNDKVENVRSIADQLSLDLSSVVFIDDNPVERDRIRQMLPKVLVLGDDPFALRRWLLTEPCLQPLFITAESADRTQLVRAQLLRAESRLSINDESKFLESLGLTYDTSAPVSGDDVSRLKELFDRTTQFNTTGRRFSHLELSGILTQEENDIFALRLRDKFGDHGLVGGCVVEAGEITALAVSCRVLGLGVEHRFMKTILAKLSARPGVIVGLLVHQPRNLPVRNIFKDHGFTEGVDGRWYLDLDDIKLCCAESSGSL